MKNYHSLLATMACFLISLTIVTIQYQNPLEKKKIQTITYLMDKEGTSKLNHLLPMYPELSSALVMIEEIDMMKRDYNSLSRNPALNALFSQQYDSGDPFTKIKDLTIQAMHLLDALYKSSNNT